MQLLLVGYLRRSCNMVKRNLILLYYLSMHFLMSYSKSFSSPLMTSKKMLASISSAAMDGNYDSFGIISCFIYAFSIHSITAWFYNMLNHCLNTSIQLCVFFCQYIHQTIEKLNFYANIFLFSVI